MGVIGHWVTGAVIFAPNAAKAGVIGILAYVISLQRTKGTSDGPSRASAVFVTTWCIAMACLLLIDEAWVPSLVLAVASLAMIAIRRLTWVKWLIAALVYTTLCVSAGLATATH